MTEWSAGCVFKNPDPELSDGRSAGRWSTSAAARSCAAATPSSARCTATSSSTAARRRADDVFALIEDVRDLVAERTGIDLKVEVQTWG